MGRRTVGRYDAVVLAGGASRRMGGGDKTALAVGGLSLLERALEAAAGCRADDRRRGCAADETQRALDAGGAARRRARRSAGVRAAAGVRAVGPRPRRRSALRDGARRWCGCLLRLQPAGAVMVDDDRPRPVAAQLLADGVAARGVGGRSGRPLLAPSAGAADARAHNRAGEKWPEWFDCDDPADVAAAKELLDEPARRLAR